MAALIYVGMLKTARSNLLAILMYFIIMFP